MARIRQIKPELRKSLTAAEWPREVRYAWVLLWGYLDDHGRGLDDLRLIVADLFPLDDDVTTRKLSNWLDLMSSTKTEEDDVPPLCRYEVRGKRYLHATSWTKHQRVAHAQDSRIPACPIHEPLMNDSRIIPESIPKDSVSIPELARARGSEDQGSESQRIRGSEDRVSATASGTRIPDPFPITNDMLTWIGAQGITPAQAKASTERFCDYWRAKPGKDGRKLDWVATWRNWLRTDYDKTPKTRPSTTDAAVAQGLALVERFAEKERREITT